MSRYVSSTAFSCFVASLTLQKTKGNVKNVKKNTAAAKRDGKEKKNKASSKEQTARKGKDEKGKGKEKQKQKDTGKDKDNGKGKAKEGVVEEEEQRTWLRNTGIGQLYRGLGVRLAVGFTVFVLASLSDKESDGGWAEL